MVAQVKSNYGLRNMTINDRFDKISSIFIKDVTHKLEKFIKAFNHYIIEVKESKEKKWEEKKSVQSSLNDKKNEPVLVKSVLQKLDKVIGESTLQPQGEKCMILGVTPSVPIDMFKLLS